mmetsp:Transcript_21935/g.46270  ORF Transcript_21935/g.46270 Transcript_21935/m.46270 type:complete len:446 (+) Transcript_21935:54-1391(+)
MQPIVGFFCVVLSRRCSILGYYRPSFRPEAFLARCSLSTSSSPDEVDQQRYAKLQNDARDLVQRASFKVRGSAHHTKLRRRHITLFCDAVREGLIHRDGTLYNSTNDHQHRCDATKKLVADLGGIGANQGIMPDFSSPKALRGYALGHFGRAQLLSELVTQTEPDWLDERVSELFSVPSAPSSQQHAVKAGDRKDGEKEVTLASLGGGCGYDFVALAALSEYLGGPRIAATVYEYEPAWKEIVEDVESVVRDVFAGSQDPSHHTTITTENRSQRPTHECGFEFCDITSPLNSSSNEALASEIHSIQVFSCSYVVAENAVKLQQNGFVFFRQLFAEATDGSLFLFTETTHRLWPDFIDLVRCHNACDADNGGPLIRVTIPHIRRGKSGWQLALLKSSTAGNAEASAGQTTKRENELYERFKRDNIAHLSRLDRGWKRDARKVRGAK